MSTKNIHQRIMEVMKEVTYVKKEEKKVNNQYTFVSHDAVIAKIRPALIAAGIVTEFRVQKHCQDGNRTEVDVQVDFVNIDQPNDRYIATGFGYGIDPQDKGPGKAISYALKYIFLKTFCLETGDDPEKDLIDFIPKTINEVQLLDLEALLDEVKANKKAFLNHFKIPELAQLKEADFPLAVKMLEKKRKMPA